MLKPVYIFWLFISIALFSAALVFARDNLLTLPTLRPIRTILSPSKVSPTSTENIPAEIITVDFARQISTGSPLIFGGAGSPDINELDAWDKIAEAGVTAIRRDFFIEWEAPMKISLDDYKNNVNDIQNSDKWNISNSNWTNISTTNRVFENAKNRGMKVIGILSYAPSWLTYSGTVNGVPKDWVVYEDIVRKLYTIHRPYLDYLEIWNEPTYSEFLDLTGSGLSREKAYALIFEHAVKAVKEVDQKILDNKKIAIGGSVGHNPTDTAILNEILTNSQTKNAIDFVSFHNYDHVQEPSWNNYKNLLAKYGKSDMPIFLTEWNSSYKNKTYRYNNAAVSYTGGKLIAFLKMGLPMANYYAMRDLNRSKSPNDDPSFAFYKREKGYTELLPQAKTWRILSKSLGLGKGQSRIFDTQSAANTLAAGFENSDGRKGAAFVNGQDLKKNISVTFYNYGISRLISGSIPLDVYIASAENDASSVVERLNLQPDGQGNINFTLIIPPQSVIGVIQPEGLNLRQIFRNLLPIIPR